MGEAGKGTGQIGILRILRYLGSNYFDRLDLPALVYLITLAKDLAQQSDSLASRSSTPSGSSHSDRRKQSAPAWRWWSRTVKVLVM